MYLCYQSVPTLSPARGPPAPGLVEPIVWDRFNTEAKESFVFPQRREILELPALERMLSLTGCGRNYFIGYGQREEEGSSLRPVQLLQARCVRLSVCTWPATAILTLGVMRAWGVGRQPFLLEFCPEAPRSTSALQYCVSKWNYTEHKVKEKKG